MVGVGVVLVYLWMQPPDPFRLVLVGANYDTNLALEPNVLGRKGLQNLAAWADKDKGKIGTKQQMKLDGTGDPVADGLKSSDVFGRTSKTVVVFLSGDGGADATGAFLWRDGANPKDRGAVYTMHQVLQDLAGLPEDAQKLLILDASHNGARWPMGQLHNDFVRSLKTVDIPAVKVKGLVVLCSCDVDQQSYGSEEYGQTIFAHYVLEGLKGAADQEQPGEDMSGLSLPRNRISALSLARYVQCKVKRWVRHNRASDQDPQLIDDANIAKDLELGGAGDYKGEDPPPAANAKWSAQEELVKAWKDHDDLAGDPTPPYANTPLQWREYEATLLRYEQLLRDGESVDADAPKALNDRLDKLSKQIRNARQGEGQSLANTLAAPAVFGRPVTTDMTKSFDRLWEDHQDDKIAGLLDNPAQAADRTTKQVLRLGLIGLVLAKAEAATSPDDYKRACGVLTTLTGIDPGVPLPAEANFAVMAQKMAQRITDHAKANDLPDSTAPPVDLLRRALTVRRAAETAALGMDSEPKPPARSEMLLPWLLKSIGDADAKRRVGEDQIFSAAAVERKSGSDALDSAGNAYEAARKVPATVRRALMVRDQALAELPYYTEWRGWEAGDQTDLTDLWAKVYHLCDLLDRPDAPDWQSDQAAIAASDVKKGLDQLHKEFTVACKDPFPVRATPLRQLNALLSTPLMTWDVRKPLLERERAISAKLNEQTKDADPAADEVTPSQARKLALQQARLAAAALREDRDVGDKVNTKEKEVGDKAWQGDVNQIGDMVATGMMERASHAHDDADSGRTAPLTDKNAMDGLRGAALKARFLDAAEKTAWLGDLDPVDEDRRLRLHDLLLWQAERSRLDFWVSDADPAHKPYYQSAGHLYTADAARLVTEGLDANAVKVRTKAVEDQNNLLDAAAQVQWRNDDARRLTDKGKLPVTDELLFDLNYTLVGDAGAPDGNPVVWAAPEKKPDRAPLLKVKNPANAAQPHALAKAKDETTTTYTVAPHPDQNQKKRWATGVPDAATFQVGAVFRGRYLTAETKLDLYNRPEVVSYQPQQAASGYIAVQADEGVFNSIVGRNSAMTVVLDYSGSMTLDPADRTNNTVLPRGKRRLDRALNALQTCLEKLPAGVRLTVITFRAPYDNANVPHQDIQTRFGPKEWDPRKTQSLIEELRDLPPDGATPLVETVGRAADSLRKDDRKAKTLLVITDGGDDMFEDKTPVKEREKDMEKFLHDHFDRTDISLHVVGIEFQYLPPVEKEGADAFAEAIPEVDGTFTDERDMSKLADDLRQYFVQLHYWVEDHNTRDIVSTVKKENEPVRTIARVADAGLDISTYNDTSPDTLHELLRVDPGQEYWVSVENHHRKKIGKDPTHVEFVSQKVRVQPGEVLVLNLRDPMTSDGSLQLQRDVYTKSSRFRLLKNNLGQAPADPWELTVLGNKEDSRTGKGREITTALDRTDQRIGATIGLSPPQWTWFNVSRNGEPPAAGLRFYPRPYFQAPVWRLDMAEWSPNAAPVVEAWWKDELLVNDHAFKWTKGGPNHDDFMETATELNGKFVVFSRTEDQRVFVDGVEPEPNFPVQTAPGNWETKKCLVVRLTYPPGDPYFVLPPDVSGGCEHRFYTTANRYTGVFYGVDPKNLEWLRLYSVKELKDKSHHPKEPLPVAKTSAERPQPLAND